MTTRQTIMAQNDTLDSITAVAKYMGISRGTVYKLVKLHDLPVIKMQGLRPMASKPKIDLWMFCFWNKRLPKI